MSRWDGMAPVLTNDMTTTALVVLIAIVVVWIVVRVMARMMVAAVLVGVLVVGLVVATGRLTNQPPERIVDSAVATMTAEVNRTARDAGGHDEPRQPARTPAPSRP